MLFASGQGAIDASWPFSRIVRQFFIKLSYMGKPTVIGLSLLLMIANAVFCQSSASRQDAIQGHARQAQIDLQNKKPDLAIKEYQAILAIDPDSLDARANLGVTEYFAGRYREATDQLQAALKLRPELFKLQALLGMSEKRTGDMPKAQNDLETALPHLDEEKLRTQAGMELIEVDYALNDLAKAAEVVNGLRQSKPSDPDILYTAHRIYADLVDETTLSLAMVAPQSARMHQLMAHELARRADNEGAIGHYREALKLEPHHSDLHFELAEMLNGSSSAATQAEAEKEYRAALAENPFDEKSECRLGDIAARRSDQKGALEYYTRALRLQPNDTDANLGLAKALMALHEPQEAKAPLLHAVQLEPFSPASHYRLGILYRELGQAEESRRELAEFERLKKEKNNLQSLYQSLRLQPGRQNQPDPGIPQ